MAIARLVQTQPSIAMYMVQAAVPTRQTLFAGCRSCHGLPRHHSATAGNLVASVISGYPEHTNAHAAQKLSELASSIPTGQHAVWVQQRHCMHVQHRLCMHAVDGQPLLTEQPDAWTPTLMRTRLWESFAMSTTVQVRPKVVPAKRSRNAVSAAASQDMWRSRFSVEIVCSMKVIRSCGQGHETLLEIEIVLLLKP